jgi:hypothetical protein
MRKSSRLPTRFPEGTKYVVESDGGVVRRFVEFPNGRKIALSPRKAMTCCADEITIVPVVAHAEAKRARRRARAVEMA